MKKVAFLLALVLMLCPVFAMADTMLGGWVTVDNEETVLPEDAQTAFDKAFESFVGATYKPISLLATQLVAGTNYCVLCEETMVTAEPVSCYALVYFYADLQGNVSIINIAPLDPAMLESSEVVFSDEPLDGGWELTENTPATLSEEAAASLEAAMDGYVGVTLEPICEVAEQIVAGTNRCFFGKCILSDLNASTKYVMFYTYSDLEGYTELTEIFDIDIADIAEMAYAQ